jgi:hypothetical protein
MSALVFTGLSLGSPVDAITGNYLEIDWIVNCYHSKESEKLQALRKVPSLF